MTFQLLMQKISLLQEFNVSKKDIASEWLKKPIPPIPPLRGTDYVIQNRLNKLKSNNEYFNKNNGDGNNGGISP